MVDFLVMSLLVTLCLELNPVHITWPSTGFEVAISSSSIEWQEAGIFRLSIER